MGRGISRVHQFLYFFSQNKTVFEAQSQFPFASYLWRSVWNWVIDNPGTTFLIFLGIGGSLALTIAIFGFGAMTPLLDLMASHALDSVSAFIHATGWESLTPVYTLQYFSAQLPILMTLAPLVLTHGLHTVIDTCSPEKPEPEPKLETTKDGDTSTRPNPTDDLQKDSREGSLQSSSVYSKASVQSEEPFIIPNPSGAPLQNGLGTESQ